MTRGDGNGDVDADKRATIRRFATLGAVGSLAALADAGAAETETPAAAKDAETADGVRTREAVLGYLATVPGAHFSKIRDDLSLGTGEAQHHLRRLVEAGTVETFRDGDYRRYVRAGRFDDFQKTTLGYLRRETPRGMLLTLLEAPTTAPSELATRLDVARSTISKYARELEEAGLLDRSHETGYTVRRPETVLTLVVRYADSLGPAAVDLAATADSLVRYTPPEDGV